MIAIKENKMSIYHMFNTKIAKKLGMVEAVLLDNIERTINKLSDKYYVEFKDWGL